MIPANLPRPGWLERRARGAVVYLYWRWRDGRHKRSIYLGKVTP